MAILQEDPLHLKASPHWLRNYLPMWVGQMFSLLGSAVVQFALVWHLTKTTGSATVLAMATFIGLIPGVVLGPFAGALVDRWNRKKIMIWFDLIVAAATGVLILLFAFNLIQIWHIYTAMFLRSLAGCFQWPAATASTSMMVPDEQMTRISGINQAVNGAINIVAPPLGAVLIASIPMFGVLMVDLVTAAIAVGLLVFLVTVPQPAKSADASAVTVRSVLADTASGLRFTVQWRGLFIVLLFATILNAAFTPAFSFLPLLVTQHFEGGAHELAWLEASVGAGIVLGGIVLGIWGGFRRKMKTMLIGLVLMGLGIVLFGIASKSQYWVAVAGGLLTGFMSPIVNGPFFALVQSKVPHEIQGKVFSMINSVVSAASPIGMLLAAPIANQFGLQFLFMLAAVVTMLLGVSGFFIKPAYTLDDQLPGGALISAEPAAPAIETI